MEITVSNRQRRVAISGAAVRRIARCVLGKRADARGQIHIMFVTDRAIRPLNRRFHRRDCATDVLAFDLSVPGELRADIAVSTDTAERNSRIFSTTPRFESYLYVIHALLHLKGYGDATGRERLSMRSAERRYVRLTGI